MKKNPRLMGDEHVKSVYFALINHLNNQSIQSFPNTTIQTVYYLTNIYPNILNVVSKFDKLNSNNEKDLTLFLNNGETIFVNLFSIKKGSFIQPKNPGAKSFFAKYFLSDSLQSLFNHKFEQHYLKYLQAIVEKMIGEHYISNVKELKRRIKIDYPKFTNDISEIKDVFLYSLREECFSLLKDSYNIKDRGYIHAYDVFFMTSDLNIITQYGKTPEDVIVEEFKPGIPSFKDIQIYKIGNDTVGIKYGDVGLTLRFKFESGPTSSVKLASGCKSLKETDEIKLQNSATVKQIEELLKVKYTCEKRSDSNAIGKCHEAFTYYYFLKDNSNIKQVNSSNCINQLEKYYPSVTPETLNQLYKATSTIIPVIKEKLEQKYPNYQTDSIELVPESYVKDKLDSSDLQLILKVNDNYIIENFSLKAIAKKSNKITTKNPGIGTILGPSFFNSGDMNDIVRDVKKQYLDGFINHRESQEKIAEELGINLEKASQEQLKQGVENLLGNIMMGITVYKESQSFCKEHSKISDEIKVYKLTPSTIQNTLSWNDNTENINLRVKFSKGQKYGWSSIKLTSEYQLK